MKASTIAKGKFIYLGINFKVEGSVDEDRNWSLNFTSAPPIILAMYKESNSFRSRRDCYKDLATSDKLITKHGELVFFKDQFENIEVDGLDYGDAPDFCDAYISNAEINGVQLNDQQLEELNENDEFVFYSVEKYLY